MPTSGRRRGGRKHRKAFVLRLKSGLNVMVPKNTPTCDVFGCEKIASYFCEGCKKPLCPNCALGILKADISLMNGFVVHYPCPFCRGKIRICNLQSFEKDQPCKLKDLMLFAGTDEASIKVSNGTTMKVKHVFDKKNPDKGEIKATFEVDADLMLQIARLQIT